MGGLLTRNFEISVKTGDVKGAGTDANVFCVLIDEEGTRSQDIKLDCIWRNDFEKGNVDKFSIKTVEDMSKFIFIQEIVRVNRVIRVIRVVSVFADEH